MKIQTSNDPRDGYGCGYCGSQMAADQRYCLSCGSRRETARVPFQEVLSSPGYPQQHYPIQFAMAPPAFPDQQSANNSSLLTGLAVLGCTLLAFIAGSFIAGGRNNGNSQPQIIAAAPASAAIPAATADESTKSSDDSKSEDESSKDDSSVDTSDVSEATDKKSAKALKVTAEVKKKSQEALAKSKNAKTQKEAQDASKAQPDVLITP